MITAIADTIEENIPSQYRVAIEQRTYLSNDSDSVLVGIPDVSVFFQNTSPPEYSSTARDATRMRLRAFQISFRDQREAMHR